MNVCTKVHGDPAGSLWDILPKTTNVNLMLALEEELGDRQR